MARSQNGYTANDRKRVSSRLVPGTTRYLTVVKGAPGDLLLEWAAWFDKNVENIDAARGALDDWGYAERPIRDSPTEISNHASGTAIDLNALRHMLGRRGTFTPAQVSKIHAELRQYGGCIRWGGDYQNRADEMHFEIVKSPADCARALKKIRNNKEDDMPAYRDWAQADKNALAADVTKTLLDAKLPNKDDKGKKQGTMAVRNFFTNLEWNQDRIEVTLARIESLLNQSKETPK